MNIYQVSLGSVDISRGRSKMPYQRECQHVLIILITIFHLVFLTNCQSGSRRGLESEETRASAESGQMDDSVSPPPPESLPAETPMSVATSQFTASPPEAPDNAADIGLLVFSRRDYYGWFKFTNHEQVPDAFTSLQLLEGPGQSPYQVFSHYSDQIAYWTATNPGELWVSDVTYQEPEMILRDQDEHYVPSSKGEIAVLSPEQFIEITWSPDDLHLFLNNHNEPELSRVFHSQTDTLESWYWRCNEIVLSSRSDRLATLCSKMEGVGQVEAAEFAVIEWGGTIWFSDILPGKMFLEALPDGTAFWLWSPGGKYLAYFDPADQEGHLFVSDAQGNVRKLLPGNSPFRQVEGIEFQQYLLLNSSPFRWANNENLLLINGFGQSNRPCPRLRDEEYGTGDSFEWHCWQLVDVDAEKILWNEMDLAIALEGEATMPLGVGDITIAPHSKAIAVYLTYMFPRIVVVNLETFQSTMIDQYNRFEHIYWAAGR